MASTSGKQNLRICTLLCDDLGPDFAPKGNYADLFQSWLERSAATHPLAILRSTGISMQTYRIWESDWPTLDDFIGHNAFDAIILTGGRAASYDPFPWVTQAKTFIRQIAETQETQHVKIFGVCLGHQIIAEAFGRQVECVGRPELGVYALDLTDEGRTWWNVDDDEQDQIRIQQFHHDQVTIIPPGFENLASTPACPCPSMIKYHLSPDGRKTGQIITMQGHPELETEMTRYLMHLRVKTEHLTDDERVEAFKRVDGVDGKGGADEERAGWAMLRFFMQDRGRVES